MNRECSVCVCCCCCSFFLKPFLIFTLVFQEDLNTIDDGETHDVVSFEQGVWCSKSWSSAPLESANLPAGNKIFCCQPGSHLRCSCPNYSEADQKDDANSSTTGCCPTTGYSVNREVDKEFVNGKWRYNFRAHSDWIATPSDCQSCLPGQYTDELNLQRTTCNACPTGWYQDGPGKPFCLPCERKYMLYGCVVFEINVLLV